MHNAHIDVYTGAEAMANVAKKLAEAVEHGEAMANVVKKLANAVQHGTAGQDFKFESPDYLRKLTELPPDKHYIHVVSSEGDRNVIADLNPVFVADTSGVSAAILEAKTETVNRLLSAGVIDQRQALAAINKIRQLPESVKARV